jgi:hypothetical protein
MLKFLKTKNIQASKNMEEKCATWKQIIKQNLSNELTQSVIKLFETNHISLKFFWTICLVIVNTLCFYMIIVSFIAFFDYEANTTSRRIFETPIPFPKITICNYNQFQTQYAVEFVKNSNPDFFRKSNGETLNAEERKHFSQNAFDRSYSEMLRKNFSFEDRKKLGHILEDILFDCEFNNKPCSAQDFTWKFSNFYGNCYVFNGDIHSNKIRNSFIAGSLFGLKLQLYANFNQQLNEFNAPYGPAIYLRIENGTSLKGDTFDGVMLPAGFITYISIDRTFSHNLKKPYSNCDFGVMDSDIYSLNSDLFKLILHSPYDYTQELCLYQCLQKKVINKCNCIDPIYVSLFEDVEFCGTKEQIDCKASVFNQTYISNFIKEVKNSTVNH